MAGGPMKMSASGKTSKQGQLARVRHRIGKWSLEQLFRLNAANVMTGAKLTKICRRRPQRFLRSVSNCCRKWRNIVRVSLMS